MGLLSLPDANHPGPVPVGGGIAVWMASAAVLIVMAARGHEVGGLGIVFAGASLLFLAGVWDDVRLLHPGTKLLIQVGAAAAMVVEGVVFPLGPNL